MKRLYAIAQKKALLAMMLVTCIGIILTACGSSSDATNTTSNAGSTCSGLPKLTKKDHYTVGFSQGESSSSAWRQAETTSIQAEATKRGDQLIVTQAGGDEQKQIADVNSLVAQKVDALFIAPLTATPLAQAVLNAHTACIPVFLLDRDVDHTVATPGKDYVAFLGSDFVSEGKTVADWLINATHGNAKILELQGTIGASAAVDRQKGFDDEVKTATGMQILDAQSGNFDTATAQKVFKSLLAAYPGVTAVFTQNDAMSYGVLNDLIAAGKTPGKDVIVVSIDGESKSIQNIAAGNVGVDVSCSPKFGPLAFDTLEQYAAGQPLPTWVKVQDHTYTRANAAASVPEGF